MDWVWYIVAIVVLFFVASFVTGIVQFKRKLNTAWQRLSDAFNGARERRAIHIAPEGAADCLDYDGANFLGFFELTTEFLRFYRYQINDGAVIEVPVAWIQKTSRITDHHEPAAAIEIKTPNGEKFSINAIVPEQLCSRIVRLGDSA